VVDQDNDKPTPSAKHGSIWLRSGPASPRVTIKVTQEVIDEGLRRVVSTADRRDGSRHRDGRVPLPDFK
jgi:hypothetical protein